MKRITIREYGGDIVRGIPTVKHWQLFFDDLFLDDTSNVRDLAKWHELANLVNTED